LKVHCKLAFLVWFFSLGSFSQADVFTFEGLGRTRESWMREYLAIDDSHRYTSFELEQLKKHLLTTGAFTKVDVIMASDSSKSSDVKIVKEKTTDQKQTDAINSGFCSRPKTAPSSSEQKPIGQHICIVVEEKWTTIPVVRGEFGGGTPLRVLGIYDIHTFGSLVTSGAEFRQYGSSDPGFVAWAKAPRFKDGRYSLGAEVWKDIRMRTVYNGNRESLGEFEERSSRIRLFYFHPLNNSGVNSNSPANMNGEPDRFAQELPNSKLSSGTYQAGFDFHLTKQNPTSFRPAFYGARAPFTFETKPRLGARLYLSTIFDNITIDQYDYEGLRNILRLGVDLNGKFVSELQTFGYVLLGDLNLTSHLNVHNHSGSDLSEQRFLGGFDGVRGFIDGAQVGPKSWQWNNEAKWNFFRTSHVWLMFAGFLDTGRAGNHLEINDRISSAGLGIRIASPKIYRLMLRIDHGWSIDGSKQKGFSIGLNDFFQPYKPL